ncbi:PAS domain S-box protein [Patescibacteria group bacterium]|nr:PAS domain S-box protein [Patescibacteria group bacterium]
MAFSKNFKNIIYKLKLPEMLLVWVYWVIFLLALVVAIIFIENLLGIALLLATLFVFGALFSYKTYKLAIKNLSKNLSYGRLESIVTNLEDAVMAYDDNFKILLFNSTAEKIFGLTKEQVMGQIVGPEKVSDSKFTLLVQTLFPSLAPAVVGRSESGKLPQVVDITFSNPDREFRVSTDRILNKDGTLLGFVKLVKDRTREVQLIKSKSDFVSVAAHQLRTPLTAIDWTLESLSKNTKLDEEDRSLAKNGLVATNNLLKTVNDLLNTAEIEDGRFGYKYQTVDLIKFIDDILANAQIVSKQYGLSLYFDKGGYKELKMSVDPTKLGLAISNLVDNAMKYNSKNGSVTVSLKQVKDKPYVQIDVQDTGVGISPSDVESIFQKFFRSANARKIQANGSGLGLYITKNIIQQHGGTIWVESTLGRGTTFSFTLPTDPSLMPKAEFGIA